MAIDKTKGQTLYFSQWGGERPIPFEFVAAMERAEERTSGYAVDEDVPQSIKDDPDVLEAAFDTRERRTNEKVLVVIRKKNGIIGPLRDIRTTADGQSVQVDATMFRKADTTFVIAESTATTDVSVKDLGNGWSIQEVAVSGSYSGGVFTPAIFQGVELTTKREDPVPDEFRRGLPITETQSIVEGTVVQPTLGVNDLEAIERQIALHKKLLSRMTRDGITLPFSLVNKQTNDKKQLVIVTDTYRLVGSVPSISTTEDVKVLDLGDGHEVLTTEIIPELFGGESYTKEIVDVLPERFRANLPTTRTRAIVQGTAANPSLSAGDLMASESQITSLTKLVELLTRAGIAFPVQLTDTATITEYGGGKVNIDSFIDVVGTYEVDEGEGVVSSKITNLGEGHELKESVTRAAGAWPISQFFHFNRRLQVLESGTDQVVAANTSSPGITGALVTEVEKIDGYRELKRTTAMPLAAVDAYVRVLYGNNTNVDVPPHLESLNGYVDVDGGLGSYSENGTYALSGSQGYGQIQLHGTAQASASAIPELGWVVRIPRTSNIPCIHVLLYVLNGTSRANIITALNVALGSPGLADWPNFRPQPITVKGVGGKVNLQAQVSASAHDSITTDYLGEIKFNSWSRSAGTGFSTDSSVLTKIFNIPPTIHGNLSFTGVSDLWTTDNGLLPVGLGGTGHASYTARGTINGGTDGAQPDTGYLSCAAHGKLDIISSATATTGKTDYSGLSLCVHRLVSELDPDYPRTRVFAEIVDFADIIP